MIVRLIFLVLLCMHLTKTSESARILGVFTMPSPSHYFLGNTLMKGLAEAGHDVTFISPYSDKNPPKNGKWREIIMDELVEEHNERMKKFDAMKIGDINPLFLIFMLNKNKQTESTLNHTKVQNLIKSGEKFDVVIVPQFFNDGLKALSNHFNAHLVLLSNIGSNSWLNHLVGNPSIPSHFPELLLNYPPKMTFFQRLKNSLLKLTTTLNFNLIFYPKENKSIQKYIPHPTDINDALYNVSLVLLNSHPSISDPQPSVPCMIEIGGFHVKPPKKLPTKLQTFLDNATEGVIYFSLGSNLKSTNLSEEKRNAILNAFGRRKEKILWKWEDDVMPGQPSNIMLSKWVPQQDVLAHPNVKLFVTHGGMLSLIETVYHGVPIIAIPIFGDQKMNAETAEIGGYGRVLQFQKLSEESFASILDEVLENPKYTENAKKRSIIMNDRQVKPLDNAIYWIEYVIRHNGAKHLRVPYLDLTWYQFYLIDVIGFIFGIILLCVLILKIVISACLRRRRQNKEKLKWT